MFDGMEGERERWDLQGPTRDEALAMLDTVTSVTRSAEWRQRRWATALLAVSFGALVISAAWEQSWWVLGLLLLLAALLWLLRRRLFNPYVRYRPWQHLEDESRGGWRRQWPILWTLWIPTTILLPSEPWWPGLILGSMAALHAYFFFGDFGKIGEFVGDAMTPALDPILHPINRLSMCAALRAAGAVEGGARDCEMRFSDVRDLTGLNDATLSGQLGVLRSHGYVSRRHEYGTRRVEDGRWVSLTEVGAAALDGHLSTLQQIADTAVSARGR